MTEEHQGLRVTVIVEHPISDELPGELTYAIVDLLTDMGLGADPDTDPEAKSLVYTGTTQWHDTPSLVRRIMADQPIVIVSPPRTRGGKTFTMGRKPADSD